MTSEVPAARYVAILSSTSTRRSLGEQSSLQQRVGSPRAHLLQRTPAHPFGFGLGVGENDVERCHDFTATLSRVRAKRQTARIAPTKRARRFPGGLSR